MGRYDQRAREFMRSAFGQDWGEGDESVYSFGEGGGYGQVDGTVAGRIAVEFGVGSPKQIRAAILELALHPYEGKLLVLVDTPGHSTARSVGQAGRILEALGCSGVIVRISSKSPADHGQEQLVDRLAVLASSCAPEIRQNVIHLLDTVEGSDTNISH